MYHKILKSSYLTQIDAKALAMSLNFILEILGFREKRAHIKTILDFERSMG